MPGASRLLDVFSERALPEGTRLFWRGAIKSQEIGKESEDHAMARTDL